MTKARDLANASTALSAVSATELGYVDGVTSAIQTQMDAKLATATAATTYVANSLADAKGDLLTATADNTPARLAVGSNGETLVADSSTSTGLRWQGSAIGKNAVFNSGFDIFQRTSTPTTGLTTTGGIAYTLDRWQTWTFGAGGSVVTSQQVTSDTTNLPFIRYCARFRRATGNTDTNNLAFGQALENTDSARFIGQTVTMSFYARRGANYSQTANQLLAQLWSNTTTDAGLSGVQSGLAVAVNNTVTLTTTWQRFQATGTVSSTATQIALAFIMTPSGTAGAADFFEVTGVQLELGSIATPFAKMGGGTIQGELAACQRYFQTFPSDGTTQGAAIGQFYSTTAARLFRQLPVTMRAVGTTTFPTVYTNAIEEVGVAFRTPTAYSVVYAGPDTLGLSATGMSGATANAMAVYVLSNKISVSAEL